jgi:hypothetical protein
MVFSKQKTASEVTVTCEQIGEIIFVICAESRVQLSNLFHILDEMVPSSALHSFYGNYAEVSGVAALRMRPQWITVHRTPDAAEKVRPFLLRKAPSLAPFDPK